MSQRLRVDRVEVVHVVIPAHDEAELLPASLLALGFAVDHLHRRTSVRARLTVVLDDCTDASASVCAAHGAGLDVLEVSARNVGAARAQGVERARELASADGVPPEHTWIAHTDADTRVPCDWLTDQVDVAEAGADVVLGRVEPDATAGEAVVARWHTFHPPGLVGVHGANLGVRLSASLAVGGMAPLREQEDLDLVRRLLASGARYGEATRPVLTSSRLTGRTAGGFASYLADLVVEPGGVGPVAVS